MLELSRTVRLCINSAEPGDADLPRHNTFSAWPPMRGLGRYYELQVVCAGSADARTGYFINIKHIDTAVREHALPRLREAVARESEQSSAALGALLHDLLESLQQPLQNSVIRLTLQLTPWLAIGLRKNNMHEVLLSQHYEFSAAHRLHVPEYSVAENQAVFGKCNNPAGHGHNYRLQVVARCPVDEHGRTVEPAALDAAVDAAVIEKLDHKHLNVDVPEFADKNPSVEHIVQVIWGMLADQLPGRASLEEISVWETGKTVCTYRGKSG